MAEPHRSGLHLPNPKASRAILIGVSNYTELPPLPSVGRNVEALFGLLTAEDLWGLPPENCVKVVDPPGRQYVLDVLHDVASSAEDVLLVYFAGHGLLDEEMYLHLALGDSDTERLYRSVPYGEVRREVIKTARQCSGKVVILDCCFSGRAGRDLSGGPDFSKYARIQGTYLMTASAGTSVALAPPEHQYTTFTGALIDSLRDGVPDGPDLLDVETLFQDVRANLIARGAPQPQRYIGNDGRAIVLARNRWHPPARKAAGRSRPNGRFRLWGAIPPRNPYFTGRADLIQSLFDRQAAAAVPIVLHGLAGIGKTQLAVEYAHRYQSSYDLVWWIESDDESSVRRSLVALARRLDIQAGGPANDKISDLLDRLNTGRQQASWLLIYDNASDPQALHKYVPTGPGGHVIITSRSGRWSDRAGVLAVEIFSPAESLAFLGRRWPDLTERDARVLADRLGGLPLALEQAATKHERDGTSLTDYLAALDDTPEELLAQGIPAHYPRSLATTFTIAYRDLAAESPAAADLLRVCAFLGPQPVSMDLLIRGRRADLPPALARALRGDSTRRRFVRALEDSALATYDPGRNLLRVHNLSQELLRARLTGDEAGDARLAAQSLLAVANPGDPDNAANWPVLGQITAHLRASDALDSDDPEVMAVVVDQLRYLYAIGDYQSSRDLAERAVSTWRTQRGVDDEMALIACRHWGNALRELAEFDRVYEINRHTLELMRVSPAFGPEHEYTLAVANSHGADLRLIGEFEQAYDLDEHNLELYRRRLGDTDLGTLRSANNLAADLRLLGRFLQALDLDLWSTRRRASLFGEDDPRTLQGYLGLVSDYLELGDYATALRIQLPRLRAQADQLPPSHADVLRAQRNVAILQRRNGDYALALDEAVANQAGYESRFGPRHEKTFAATLTLSNALRAVGDITSAYAYARQAHQGYAEAFGPAHPMALAALVDLAIAARLNGDHERAEECNQDALDGLTARFPHGHPWTLCALNDRSTILRVLGRAGEAVAFSGSAASQAARILSANHPFTLAYRLNHALDAQAADDPGRAAETLRDTVADLGRVLGRRHPDTVAASGGTRLECDIEMPFI